MCVACSKGYLGVARLIIGCEGGLALVSMKNSFGNTPLHEASVGGYCDLIELLCASGADIQAENNRGSTPLHFSCYCSDDNDDPLIQLLASGAEPNIQDLDGTAPLHIAAHKGHPKKVSALLGANADKTVLDSGGHSPLFFGEISGNRQVIALLQMSK